MAKEEEKKEIERMIDEYIDLIPKAKSESIRARYEEKVEGLDAQLKELEKEPENKKAPGINEALNLTAKLLGTPKLSLPFQLKQYIYDFNSMWWRCRELHSGPKG